MKCVGPKPSSITWRKYGGYQEGRHERIEMIEGGK